MTDSFEFVLVVDGLYVKNLGNRPPKKIPLTTELAEAHKHNTKLKAMCKAENIMRKYGVYAQCLQVE